VAGFRTYIEETIQELVHKVSWPTWKELQSSAIIVLVASVMIALVVFLMDFVFGIRPGDGAWKGILGFFYDMMK
jgi:preprotein translocase subunit SecE